MRMNEFIFRTRNLIKNYLKWLTLPQKLLLGIFQGFCLKVSEDLFYRTLPCIFVVRDDAHMTSMKTVQVSRPSPSPHPPCPSTSKILPPPWPWMSNFKRSTSSSQIDNQSVKRKHNPRMTIICYQVLTLGRLLFSISTH